MPVLATLFMALWAVYVFDLLIQLKNIRVF